MVAAGVMKKMRTPAPRPSPFPTTADWAKGLASLRHHFNGGTGPIPENLVVKAESLYPWLNETVKNPQLLHGDLHHDNILAGRKGTWLAIDPKGVIGEMEYEVISFLMNHLPEADPIAAIRRRVDLFVKELHLQRERVLAWAFCHTILSAWWYVEDGDDCIEEAVEKAMLFARLWNEVS